MNQSQSVLSPESFEDSLREARYWERRAYDAAQWASEIPGTLEGQLLEVASGHYAARSAHHYEQCAIKRAQERVNAHEHE